MKRKKSAAKMLVIQRVIFAFGAILLWAGCAQPSGNFAPPAVPPSAAPGQTPSEPAAPAFPAEFTVTGTRLVEYTGNESHIVIPDGITVIGEGVFWKNSRLVAVEIPESVTTIEPLAFAQTGLEEITLPASLQNVGEEAFAGNGKLKSVRFLADKTQFGRLAFYRNHALETVELPARQDVIASGMFQDTPRLSHIDIPDSVHTIGRRAFYGAALTDVTLPANIQVIDEYAFEAVSTLVSVKLSQIPTDPSWEKIADEKTNGIYAYAFTKTALTSFEVPKTINSLGGWAFIGANELRELIIPETVTSLDTFVSEGRKTLKIVFRHSDPEKIRMKGNSFPNRENGFALVFTAEAEKKIQNSGSDSRWKSYEAFLKTR